MLKLLPQKRKKVFIGPLDSGLNNELKIALEKLGYQVTTLNFVANHFNFKNDLTLGINRLGYFAAAGVVLKNFFRSFFYDIYSFRFGQSLLPWNLDLPVWKLLGKKVLMRFDGDDIRQSRGFRLTKYSRLFIENSTLPWARDFKNIVRFYWIKLWTDKITVSTPDLVKFAPGAEFLPNLVPMGEAVSSKPQKNRKITIFHAPTDRKIKGTKYIIAAVNRLKREKFPVELVIYENRPHQEIGQYFQAADIVIDQLLMGAMSVVSLEGMRYGKPVICYIRDDLRKYYPKDLPVISANSDNIYEVLQALISEKSYLAKLGKKSAVYAKKNHDPVIIAKAWDKIFQSIY
jgi:hypothetical protein